MIILIFAFLLIARAVMWGVVVHRTHNLEKESTDREARGLIATQKYSALSFILETAIWFMLIIPNTPLSLRGGEELIKFVVLGLYSLQLIPAMFAMLWWEGLIEARKDFLAKLQNFFGIAVLIVIIFGVFAVLYAVLTSPIIGG